MLYLGGFSAGGGKLDFLNNEQFYRQPWLLLEVLGEPAFSISLGILLIPLIASRRGLAWSDETASRLLRIFMLFIVGLIAWTYSTYDINQYLAQEHLFDRYALLGLAAAVWFHPAFVLPFLAVLYLILGQFNVPFQAFPMTDIAPLADQATLFLAFLLVRAGALKPKVFTLCAGAFLIHLLLLPAPGIDWLAALGILALAIGLLFILIRSVSRIPVWAFFFLAICYQASVYFLAGFEKLAISPEMINWVRDNELGALGAYRFSQGWLSFPGGDTQAAALQWLTKFSTPILALVLVLELSALWIMRSRATAVALLVLFALLHVMVFVFTGLAFWHWFALDLALATILLNGEMAPLFRNRHYFLSILLILLAGYLFKPPVLSWYDTRLSYVATYKAVGESGTVYQLDRNFFAPYQFYFSTAHVLYLLDEPLLVSPYGTRSWTIARALQDGGEKEVEVIKQRFGINSFNQFKAQRFERFIQEYFMNLNATNRKKPALGKIAPPHHIYSTEPGLRYDLQEPVRFVAVSIREQYFDGRRTNVLWERLLREIAIPVKYLG